MKSREEVLQEIATEKGFENWAELMSKAKDYEKLFSTLEAMSSYGAEITKELTKMDINSPQKLK